MRTVGILITVVAIMIASLSPRKLLLRLKMASGSTSLLMSFLIVVWFILLGMGISMYVSIHSVSNPIVYSY